MNAISRLQTISSTNIRTNVTVITRSTEKQVNSAVCGISSLEVYRGREQATEINHTGFALDDSGTFEVKQIFNH